MFLRHTGQNKTLLCLSIILPNGFKVVQKCCWFLQSSGEERGNHLFHSNARHTLLVYLQGFCFLKERKIKKVKIRKKCASDKISLKRRKCKNTLEEDHINKNSCDVKENNFPYCDVIY